MIINHEHEFVYVALPKTGSYSIHGYFKVGDHPEPHLHHAGIRELPPFPEHYFKFAFVRNPWSKLVSIYHDFTLRRGCQYSGLVWHDKPLLSEFKDFEDFCRGLGQSHWFGDVFFRPQSVFVTNPDGSIAMDYVGRFEQLDEDFEQICSAIGVSYHRLEEANKGQYDKGYREYYTDETRAIIGELYREDVERFGYEF